MYIHSAGPRVMIPALPELRPRPLFCSDSARSQWKEISFTLATTGTGARDGTGSQVTTECLFSLNSYSKKT